MQILLIGHSHIQCIVAAHANHANDCVLDAVHLYRDKMVGNEPDMPKYIEKNVAQLLKARGAKEQRYDLVALLIGGNTHNTLGLIKMEPPFDYVLGSHPALPVSKDAFLIPEAVIKKSLKDRMRPLLDGIGALKNIFGGDRVVCVESPPPIGDDDYVRKYLDEHFREGFAAGRDIVSAELRYKLWRTSCGIYSEQSAKLALPYIPCPASTLVDGMYLKPEGYPKNVTHGNQWFGEQVLMGLVAWAKHMKAGT